MVDIWMTYGSIVVTVSYRSATYRSTNGQSVEIETSTCFCNYYSLLSTMWYTKAMVT